MHFKSKDRKSGSSAGEGFDNLCIINQNRIMRMANHRRLILSITSEILVYASD